MQSQFTDFSSAQLRTEQGQRTALQKERTRNTEGSEQPCHRETYNIQSIRNISRIGEIVSSKPSAVQQKGSCDRRQRVSSAQKILQNNILHTRSKIKLPKQADYYQQPHSQYKLFNQQQKLFKKPTNYFSKQTDIIIKNQPLLRRGQFEQPIRLSYQAVQSSHKQKYQPFSQKSNKTGRYPTQGQQSINPQKSIKKSIQTQISEKELGNHILSPTKGKFYQSNRKKSLNSEQLIRLLPLKSIGNSYNKCLRQYTSLTKSQRWIRSEQVKVQNCMNRIVGLEMVKYRLMSQPSLSGQIHSATLRNFPSR